MVQTTTAISLCKATGSNVEFATWVVVLMSRLNGTCINVFDPNWVFKWGIHVWSTLYIWKKKDRFQGHYCRITSCKNHHFFLDPRGFHKASQFSQRLAPQSRNINYSRNTIEHSDSVKQYRLQRLAIAHDWALIRTITYYTWTRHRKLLFWSERQMLKLEVSSRDIIPHSPGLWRQD